MYFIGIDIGSTASKVVVLGDTQLEFVLPTGWNSKETSQLIKEKLLKENIDVSSNEVKVIATGYGRISVDYADKIITEITCHGRGGKELAQKDCTIIDIGGQDTKIITLQKGIVVDFLMNDKCSAGTGKFIEVMANRLGVTIEELFKLATYGKALPISSICTVFAESEIINYIGEGRDRSDIAAGVIDSVVTKVSLLCNRHGLSETLILTGGLSGNQYFTHLLGTKLKKSIVATPRGRYAGALGAALIAQDKQSSLLQRGVFSTTEA
ncbi:acyl-CoA dehydratase activase [Clostridium sp.]|uniref:acyl-CoA dehydratase activase n=1 Tax=Clostridium sp. TaxID=1506 RepID=UPI0032176CAA